jgi:hypothetical protein
LALVSADATRLTRLFGRFFTQHWIRENPIRNVEIPSDKDAVRMHVPTTSEEQQYFKRAAKHRDLRDIGRLMLNQGPRPCEVVSLVRSLISPQKVVECLPSASGRQCHGSLCSSPDDTPRQGRESGA